MITVNLKDGLVILTCVLVPSKPLRQLAAPGCGEPFPDGLSARRSTKGMN